MNEGILWLKKRREESIDVALAITSADWEPDTSYTLTGVVNPSATIEYRVNGGLWTPMVNLAGTFAQAITLLVGANTVSVRANFITIVAQAVFGNVYTLNSNPWTSNGEYVWRT